MDRTYNDKMFIDTFEHSYTWLNGFMRNVRRYKTSIALIDPYAGKQWTYEQLNVEANKLAHALESDGVGKNDVVMIALENCPAFAFSYIGPRKIGAILNPINFNLSAGEIALLMEHNKPKVFIYSAEISDRVVLALERSKHKPLKVVMADNLKNRNIPNEHVSYEDYVKGQPETDPVMKVRPHIYDEVLRLCTSGTTALPKNVPLNDINEVLSAHDIIMHYPLNTHDRLLNMTPWFHRGGCHVGGPCPSFYVGAAIVIMRTFSPRMCLEYAEKYQITFFMGAPASLEMLAQMQESKPVDLSKLRGLITMGAPFEKNACMRYLKILTPNIFNGYGTTETLWNSFLRPYDLPDHAGTVGRSCIDDEVRVVNIYEGRKAEPEDVVAQDNVTVGEVIIFSPAKTTYSYYNNPDMEKEKFYKGWMYTGDVGVWDKETFVTINGRKDDMIICSGENIYPTQIEEVLADCPKVQDSIVTCIPDRLRGQVVVAYVVPKDETLTVKELSKYCIDSHMLSTYKCPRWYKLVKELPRTATGKKMHYVMKEQALKDKENGSLVRG